MKVVKCAICGREFETTRPNKKFCSFICKEANEKLWRMKWKDRNPDYQKDYQRKYRERKRMEDSPAPTGT